MFRLVTDEETYEQGTWNDVETVLHQIVADERVFFSLFWGTPKETMCVQNHLPDMSVWEFVGAFPQG